MYRCCKCTAHQGLGCHANSTQAAVCGDSCATCRLLEPSHALHAPPCKASGQLLPPRPGRARTRARTWRNPATPEHRLCPPRPTPCAASGHVLQVIDHHQGKSLLIPQHAYGMGHKHTQLPPHRGHQRKTRACHLCEPCLTSIQQQQLVSIIGSIHLVVYLRLATAAGHRARAAGLEPVLQAAREARAGHERVRSGHSSSTPHWLPGRARHACRHAKHRLCLGSPEAPGQAWQGEFRKSSRSYSSLGG